MVRLYEIRLEINEEIDMLKKKCEKLLGTTIKEFKLIKKSIDARKKQDIFYSCTVDCEPAGKISPNKKLKFVMFFSFCINQKNSLHYNYSVYIPRFLFIF